MYQDVFEDGGLEDEGRALPSVVHLSANDNLEAVLEELHPQYERLLSCWSEATFEREQARETRYDEEDPRPTFPVLIRTVSRSTRPRPTVLLPDGRRAELLDSRRVRTLCGIQTILLLDDVRHLRGTPVGSGRCVRCGGRHVAGRATPPAVPQTPPPTVPCPKCGANLHAASYASDEDTRHCLHCGTIITRPLPDPLTPPVPLTNDELAANEAAIARALREADAESEEEDDDMLLDPTQDSDGPKPGDEEAAATYDDQLSLDVSAEATPFTVEDLQTLQQALAEPGRLHQLATDSPWIERLLAQAESRLEGPRTPETLAAAFTRVVAEDVSALADLLHDPAFRLFQTAQSPLRRRLIDVAIREIDQPARRMAIWAAAGRLLHTHRDTWLEQGVQAFHPEAPREPGARTAFLTRICAMVDEQTTSIVEHLLSLTQEDLAVFAGDPDATHPFLHCPDPEVFEPTDRLLRPLIDFLGHKLQRFRNKPRGCALLASDYGLSVEALETIARQSGQLPTTA